MQYDLSQQAIRRNPYAVLNTIRQAGGLQWNAKVNTWMVLDYQVGVSLFKDRRLSNDISELLKRNTWPSKYRDQVVPFIDFLSNWLLFCDPPYHTQLRASVNEFFSKSRVQQFREDICQTIQEYLNTAGNQFDLVDVAIHITTSVMVDILQLPKQDIEQFIGWNHNTVRFLDVIFRTPDIWRPALHSLTEQKHYLTNFVASQLESTDENFVKAMTANFSDKDTLNDSHQWQALAMLLGTGSETVSNLLASGTLALINNPSQLQLLRDQPEIITAAVAELLRYDPPVQSIFRRATADIEIADQMIREGDMILFSVGAMNRDPNVFADPDSLNLLREPNHHLSFGHGIHFCLGRWLAKLIGECFFSIVLERYKSIEIANEEYDWHHGYMLRSLKSLEITCS